MRDDKGDEREIVAAAAKSFSLSQPYPQLKHVAYIPVFYSTLQVKSICRILNLACRFIKNSKQFIVSPFRVSLFSVSSTLLLQISSTPFLILIVEIFFLTSSLFSASSPVSFPFLWPASHFSALFSLLTPFFIFFSSPLPHESPHTCSQSKSIKQMVFCSLFTLYCL